MSDNSNERHDGATPFESTPSSQSSDRFAPPAAPASQRDTGAVTAPLGDEPFPAPDVTAAPLQRQVPQPTGMPAGPQSPDLGSPIAPQHQTAATAPLFPQASHIAGGHAAPPRYGAAFGVAAGAATGAPAPAPKKRARGGMLAGALMLGILLAGGAGVGGAYVGYNLAAGNGVGAPAGPSAITVNNPDKVNNVTAVAAKVTPSVVTINVTSQGTGGSGSGVILSQDGYILTNTHVVTLGGETGNGTITVTTSDGKIYQAKVVGTDPLYDLAVIKLVGAKGLTPMKFGDSSKLNVGDQTIAVGAPLGLSNTVTSGIVSALNRSIQIQSSAAPKDAQGDSNTDPQSPDGNNGPFKFDLPGTSQQSGDQGSIAISVVQTDAAINPGNSGGALVNADGELVGINVAIASAGKSSASTESGNIGVGFAIPSDVAQRVAKQLMDTGKATHGLLGATVQTSGQDYQGAVIKEVTSGGAAATAGLQPGDVVTKLGDSPISSSTDLTAQVRAYAAGAEVKVTYMRDGASRTATVKLGELTQ